MDARKVYKEQEESPHSNLIATSNHHFNFATVHLSSIPLLQQQSRCTSPPSFSPSWPRLPPSMSASITTGTALEPRYHAATSTPISAAHRRLCTIPALASTASRPTGRSTFAATPTVAAAISGPVPTSMASTSGVFAVRPEF